ncbi:MAG: hypothetical protein IH987_13945, partial [Planctomycetes bacterium]|nr:hypothetical protein [Planctomycetota bacterium]
MRLSNRILISAFSVLAITTGGSVFAGELFSFTYSDLNGSYDGTSMLFTAADDSITDGDVTRIISPGSTALFAGTAVDGGFPGLASFHLETRITNINATTADLVAGSLQLHDLDGEVISADLSGSWTN